MVEFAFPDFFPFRISYLRGPTCGFPCMSTDEHAAPVPPFDVKQGPPPRLSTSSPPFYYVSFLAQASQHLELKGAEPGRSPDLSLPTDCYLAPSPALLVPYPPPKMIDVFRNLEFLIVLCFFFFGPPPSGGGIRFDAFPLVTAFSLFYSGRRTGLRLPAYQTGLPPTTGSPNLYPPHPPSQRSRTAPYTLRES